jgi:hypothetical protein
MSETELLIFVLAAIYLAECARWTRRGAIGFIKGSSWRLARPSSLLGNARGGLILSNPLPPLGALFIASHWPISLAPAGIFAYVAFALDDEARAATTEKYIPFAEIKSVAASENRLLVNGELFAQTNSHEYARWLAALINKLRALPENRRAAAIKSALADLLDIKSLEKRLAVFEQTATGLRWLCNLLFGYAFLVAPALAWLYSFELTWYWLLPLLFAMMIIIAVKYFLSHQRLYPENRSERILKFFMLLISPPVTMRAYDLLAHSALAPFHPLAIAGSRCQQKIYQEFAARSWRDAHYPLQPACPQTTAPAGETEAWFRARYCEALDQFLKQTGIDLAAVAQAPARDNAQCLTYCPRCHSQYRLEAGACQSCGVTLVDFTQTDEPALVRG